jgi:hypothetical protein
MFGATRAALIDLDSGIEASWFHAEGYGTCSGGSEIWCDNVEPDSPTDVFRWLTLDPTTQIWTAKAAYENVVPYGYGQLGELGLPGDGQLLLFNDDELARLDLATGTLELIAKLPGPPVGLRRLHGEKVVLSATVDMVEMARTFYATAVGAQPSTEQLFTVWVDWHKYPAVPIPAGDRWFVLHDGVLGEPEVLMVTEVDEAGQQLLGQSADLALTDVLSSYSNPHASLRDGREGLALTCASSTCRSAVVDLSKVTIAPIAEMGLPGSDLALEGRTWLSCDAVEAIVVELAVVDDTGNKCPHRWYRMRLPGRQQ